MNERQQQIVKNVDLHKEMVLKAERWLWQHPQTGFTEWEAHGYMKNIFEELGYELVLAGNIPGFYTDIETGKPGPKLCIMSELDALDIANHPESVNGMTHCCGHHGQGAAMLAIAAALKEPGALDGLSGSIRLMVVPAEEMIQLDFREKLRQEGVIGYMGGKVEFMARGFLDDVDLAMMVHGSGSDPKDPKAFTCSGGNNGCIAKVITYKGKSSHAGGGPHEGINAQYAAMLGLQACNDLRETFQDKNSTRFHPIMKGVNCAVNIIPDEMQIESYVRGKTMEAIKLENRKINRALTGGALALGARVHLCDRPGYAPAYHDVDYMRLVEECCIALAGEDKVKFNYDGWDTGSTDFGDITCVMPGVQFNSAGASGTGHGIDYCITDPEQLCLGSAKAQLFVTEALLENGAVRAQEIVKNYKPLYPSIQAYFEDINKLILDKEAVVYDENGRVTVDFFNE